MLRIGIDARLISGTVGGVESVVIGLAHGLSKLVDGDEEYVFLTYRGADDWVRPYVKEPCKILQCSLPSHRWKRWLKAVPGVQYSWHHLTPFLGRWHVRVPVSDGMIERAGIDVMHFTTQNAFLTELPNIYHPHDLQHLHMPSFFLPRIILEREVKYRTFCNQASSVVVTSSWVKQDLITQYGLHEDKVSVIPWPPVLTAYPTPSSGGLEAVQAKFALPKEFAFYPAQTWPHKNHLRLLEALAVIRDRYGLRIPFISSGKLTDYFPVIEKRVEELKLTNQVRFLGFVSPMEVQCLYKLCRCVIIPSKFEAASGPLGEAFVSKKPAACSNVTSLPCQAGDAAVLFDPDNVEELASALYCLWTDAILSQKLVERGKKIIEQLSWYSTAKAFRAHYRRIAGRVLTREDLALLKSPSLL